MCDTLLHTGEVRPVCSLTDQPDFGGLFDLVSTARKKVFSKTRHFRMQKSSNCNRYNKLRVHSRVVDTRWTGGGQAWTTGMHLFENGSSVESNSITARRVILRKLKYTCTYDALARSDPENGTLLA